MRALRNNLVVVVLLSLLMTCSKESENKTDVLDAKTKSELTGLNDIVISALETKDPGKITSILSDKLKNKLGALDLIRKTKYIVNRRSFVIKREFYVNQPVGNKKVSIVTHVPENRDYKLEFVAINEETMGSVQYFKRNRFTLALTTIYGKYDAVWKLNIIQLGIVAIDNKDVVAYYELAKKNFSDGHVVDAALNLTLGTQCLKPANEFWIYGIEHEVTQFADKINKKVAGLYHFPVVMEGVKGRPQVFGITTQVATQGVFPDVRYTTKINLKDTVALSKECDEINKTIGDYFDGLNLDNEQILYTAYSKVPLEDENPARYLFLRKTLKK